MSPKTLQTPPKHIPDRFWAIWQLFEIFDFFEPKIDFQMTISAAEATLRFPLRLFTRGIENFDLAF